MYITETTDNVRVLYEELEQKKDLEKLKFLIYIFGLLNNNQINDKNEANPDLQEDDELNIFTLESVGLSPNACDTFLHYFVLAYNIMTNSKDAYVDNGNVFGVTYNEENNKINSQFEKLNFNEKLDIFSELIIRYDNETYFEETLKVLTFDSKLNGFDIAKLIQTKKL
ncbi:MAG: hypothetical protein J6B98_04450 [Bacilli bacterium]|nr:hypothetical protein [Bacilli bacterium]